MIIAISDAEILVRIPLINNIPEITSASAIGICISTGNPILSNMLINPVPNFPTPAVMKITPIADLIPQFVTSFNFVW